MQWKQWENSIMVRWMQQAAQGVSSCYRGGCSFKTAVQGPQFHISRTLGISQGTQKGNHENMITHVANQIPEFSHV